MNKEVRIPVAVLTNAQVDQFACQQVLKQGNSRRQYRFDGVWTDTNPGKRPEASRVLLDREKFQRARAVYKVWTQIAPQFGFAPVYPESIIERMMIQNPVIFFIPWGVADWDVMTERERRAMNQIDTVRTCLEIQGITNRTVLMPADLYATKVNSKLPQAQVDNYFASVATEAQRRGYEVKPWSQIQSENINRYNILAAEFTEAQIGNSISPSVMYKAFEAAKRNSGFSAEKEIREAAFRYLRERICEAIIVEETLSPIKLSMAPKNKDNDVDMQLPRLYVLPENLVLPWKSKQPKREIKESFR